MDAADLSATGYDRRPELSRGRAARARRLADAANARGRPGLRSDAGAADRADRRRAGGRRVDAAGVVVGSRPTPWRAAGGDGPRGQRVLGVGSRPVAARCSRGGRRADPPARARGRLPAVRAAAICICELRGFKCALFCRPRVRRASGRCRVGGCRRTWTGLGHATALRRPILQRALLDLMLLAGSPLLEDLGRRPSCCASLARPEPHNARRHGVEQLARTLVEMGVLGAPAVRDAAVAGGVAGAQPGRRASTCPSVWLEWTRRWFETSTLSRSGRDAHLLRADQGRPLARPTSIPTVPTRARGIGELAAAWIARGRSADGRRATRTSPNTDYMRRPATAGR